MEFERLSSTYDVCRLTERDVEEILALAVGNPLYYMHYPPFVTSNSLLEDMRALPPGKGYADKYYIGFRKSGKLVAVMDLVTGYPNEKTAFIGFFMVEKTMQGHGVGSGIVKECCCTLKSLGYDLARLGFAKSNPQSRAFWEKNGFRPTGEEVTRADHTIVVMQKAL